MKNIILTGFMGSGKSTVGKILANRLKYNFIDTDEYIEKIENKKIKNIFIEKSEEYFRTVETKVLKEVCIGDKKVISTGGGIVMLQENINILKTAGYIVFIDVPLEVIIERLKGDETRPLIADEGKFGNLQYLFDDRHNIYKNIADMTVRGEVSVKIADDIIKSLLNYM